MTTRTADRAPAAKRADIASREWKGPWRRYDIVKEGVIALVVVSILTVLLAGLFSSPDEPPLTFQGWATSAPDNFYATAVQELAGTSTSAGYGPPNLWRSAITLFTYCCVSENSPLLRTEERPW